MPITVELLRMFAYNKFFVETGTWHGDGVRAALEAGFRHVRSVELSSELYEMNKKNFGKERRVRLFLGSSEDRLEEMIADIRKPIVFWLDAHYSHGDTARGRQMTPLLKELAIIEKHRVKDHTILIDDVRCFSTPEFDGIRESEVRQIISRLNSAYRFYYADGFGKNDILVAVTRPLDFTAAMEG